MNPNRPEGLEDVFAIGLSEREERIQYLTLELAVVMRSPFSQGKVPTDEVLTERNRYCSSSIRLTIYISYPSTTRRSPFPLQRRRNRHPPSSGPWPPLMLR